MKEMDARQTKRGEAIAAALEDEIIRAGWPVGTSLGTEVELIKRFGVARTTLREAIRQLEQYGLAEMRAGKNGGLFIARPARPVILQALAFYLQLCGVTAAAVLEARSTVDASATELAARRLDADGRQRLVAMRAYLAQAALPLDENVARQLEARSLIAELSGNPAISLCSDMLSRFTLGTFTKSRPQRKAHEKVTLFGNRTKRRIIESILERDAERARKLLLDEMAATLKWNREYSSPVSWRTDQTASDSASAQLKTGHSIALQIAHQIAVNKQGPGTRIGTEAELRVRYGVAWPVLREALRILEMHGVIGILRGKYGGMVVGRPSARAMAASVATYLSQLKLTHREFVELHQAITPTVVRLVIERASDADLAALPAPTAIDSVHNNAQMGDSLDLHERIAALTGNLVLTLFVDVLNACIRRVPKTARMKSTSQRTLREIDSRIVAALQRRDSVGVQRHMNARLRLLNG